MRTRPDLGARERDAEFRFSAFLNCGITLPLRSRHSHRLGAIIRSPSRLNSHPAVTAYACGNIISERSANSPFRRLRPITRLTRLSGRLYTWPAQVASMVIRLGQVRQQNRCPAPVCRSLPPYAPGGPNPFIRHRPATDMAARRRANLGRYVRCVGQRSRREPHADGRWLVSMNREVNRNLLP